MPLLTPFQLQAQEDADMLRSVVVPLEEEIEMLKSKVKDTADYADTLKTKVLVQTERSWLFLLEASTWLSRQLMKLQN